MARQLGGNRAHLNQRAIGLGRLDEPSRAEDGFLNALKRWQDRENCVGICCHFSDAAGCDQPLSMKRLHLLRACIVPFHFELPFEKPRGYRTAEKADADDSDSLHRTFIPISFLALIYFLAAS